MQQCHKPADAHFTNIDRLKLWDVSISIHNFIWNVITDPFPEWVIICIFSLDVIAYIITHIDADLAY